MPLAPVDDKGTQLYFEDSGAPPGCAPYPTLVLIHGTGFHGAIYSRMLSVAGTHNARFVAVNLRGYPKSTAYTAEELAVIQSGEYAAQAVLMQERGLEIAAFLTWFIAEYDVPPLSVAPAPDGTCEVVTGGVSLLGWSHGPSILLAFLAHADKLSVQTRTRLDAYLRTFILHDPSHCTLGIPAPPREYAYNPLFDASIPPEALSDAFVLWVTSFYRYSPHVLSRLAALDGFAELFAELGKTRSPIAAPPPHQRPTAACMSVAELAACLDAAGSARAHVPMLLGNVDVFRANMRDALMAPMAWPRVRVVHVWDDMSVADTVDAAAWMARTLRTAWPETGRKVEVERLAGANHFPHWHDPEGTLKNFVGLL